MSNYPFDIQNYDDLPVKVRTWLAKEWNRREGRMRSPGRPSKYPWAEWMNGKTHTALAGRDFHVSRDNFRQALRQKAYHSGMSVWTQLYEVEEKGPTGPVQFWVNFYFKPKTLPYQESTAVDSE